LGIFTNTISALSRNFYASSCPTVETIVRGIVQQKINQTFVTIPGTLRLFFHDCMVEGCDASVIIQSTDSNTAEKDYTDNKSLAGDGFDTVIKAKTAVEKKCPNKVSCADILAIATRDVVQLAGGPRYEVELGRLDGLTSKNTSVEGKLPQPTFTLNQLNTMFASHGFTQTDMMALSGAHTLGFSHCAKFSNRIYNFSKTNTVDPTLNTTYVPDLKAACPKNVASDIAINMDPNTPRTFDNMYYKNLQQRKGLFTSDQTLFEDSRSKATVNAWAANATLFNQAFVNAMTLLGRIGVKTGSNGNIRHACDAFN
jgi:peroxidase